MRFISSKLLSIKNFISNMLFILTPRQKKWGVITFVISFFGSFLQVLGVSIIVPIISIMTDSTAIMSNNYTRVIYETLNMKSPKQFLVVLCIGTAVLYLVKNMYGIFQTWLNAKYSNMVSRELAIKIMKDYMYRPYDFFLNYDSGKIYRDVENDSNSISNLIRCSFNIISEMLTMLMIVIFLFVSDWIMAVCLVVIAILCLILIYGVFRRNMKTAGDTSREYAAVNQKIFYESIEGIKEIQVMRKQDFFLEQFYKTKVVLQNANVVNIMGGGSPTYVVEGLFVSGIMLYIMLRGITDTEFLSMLPLLASFALGAIRMLPSMGRISSNINIIVFAMPSLASITENIKKINKEKELADERKVQEGIVKRTFDEKLSLEKISWNYENSEKKVLNNLDMTIEKGQSVGIIGSSGAGKSTLADIILGLHIPQKGKVLIDGNDIFSIPDDYCNIIGYVPQSIYLVDGTIRENVAFGDDIEKVKDEEIWLALDQAQLSSFVKELEHGLDTVIGERGVRFSGGQRQRLAIARALYRKPQILILDEATSALDNETEDAVMQSIEHLYGTITMIIIAHRLTTVKKCDIIYEIKNGKAVETTLNG